MSEKILEIKDERLSFFTPAGEVKALNGVSFSMNQGDVLGIVGESGSGKVCHGVFHHGPDRLPRPSGRRHGVVQRPPDRQNDREGVPQDPRGNEVSIIFQDPMTSLNPVYTIGNQIVEVILLHTKRPSRKPGPALRSCWSWSASTSRTAA